MTWMRFDGSREKPVKVESDPFPTTGTAFGIATLRSDARSDPKKHGLLIYHFLGPLPPLVFVREFDNEDEIREFAEMLHGVADQMLEQMIAKPAGER